MSDDLSNLDVTDERLCLSFASRWHLAQAQEELIALAQGKDNLAEVPGKNNWIENVSSTGLPEYIAHIAKGLIKGGMEKSRAIATAISQCKRWSAGGAKVHPDTRAKAAEAVAQWEALKAKAHGKSAARKVS